MDTPSERAGVGSMHMNMKNRPSAVFVAHESLRETVNYACDGRRSVTELAAEFPEFDFGYSERGGIHFHFARKQFQRSSTFTIGSRPSPSGKSLKLTVG